MPKIRSYDQTQTQATSRGLAPTENPSTAGAPARGLQSLIESAVDLGSAIYRRQAQNEVSELNAEFADARAEWTQKIDDQIQTGKIDTQKIDEDYTNFVDKINTDISTPAGRRFFDRQSARLKGYVLSNAARGQARLAGEKAAAEWQVALNSSGNTLQQNPGGFRDVYDSSIEAIEAQVETGAMPAAIAEKFKLRTGQELAQASIRGYANQSPEVAQKMLDSGQYDEHLTPDQKAQMQGYVNAQKTAAEIDERRRLAAEEKAKKLKSEAWQQENLSKLSNGSLVTKEILNSPMAPDEKIRWMKLADEATKQNTQSDPKVFNELTRRVLLPPDDPQHIDGITGLAPFVGKGVSIDDVTKINSFIQKLPEGQNIRDNRKRLIDFADAKLVKIDYQTGSKDPDGESNMASFVVALQEREAQFRKENKNVSDLYNPNSKDYFGNEVNKYQLTPQQINQKTANRLLNSARQQSAAAGEQMIPVISPDGRSGKVPQSKLDQYLKKGFRRK